MKTHPYSRSGRTQMAVCLIAGMLLTLSTRAQENLPIFVYFDTQDNVHYKIESSSGDLCNSSFYICFQDFFEKNPWTRYPYDSEIGCYSADFVGKCQDHGYRWEDIPPDSIKDRTWLYSAWLEDEKKARLLRKQKKWPFFERAYSTIILVLLPSHKLVRVLSCTEIILD